MTFDKGGPGHQGVSVDAFLAAAALEPLPLEDDPTARLLGLVPDADIVLNRTAIKSARARSGLSVSDVAQRLTELGWDTRTSEVLQWELRGSADIVPARVTALAVVLNQPVEAITMPVPEDARMSAVQSTEQFAGLVRRWAQLFDTTLRAAEVALTSRMATAVHRGEIPDPARTLKTMEALVDELEKRQPQ
ncbi:hypothetical protein IFT79_09580 [Frigoribacterium sp. CFBP 8759]|uniref:hypothetical protein n=1 Tax=Frigoribacterium sp. CFBP 8759 TaxID=2775283 RepID=UPI00178232B0|nr:hypothetical protein [Frigoribacterium sp. CFBP 8759]MBD8485863.1 hypothetical protein [Frigoribacterium sp. CFBP 8759]